MNVQPSCREPVASGAGATPAGDPAYTHHAIKTPDGVTLAVQEWGKADAPAIVFIHGFSAAHLVWRKQVEDPELASAFRLITFDTRGSGLSGKPAASDAYDGARLADDIATVIDTLSLERPVLVAWSAGGLVAGDYVARHGDAAIGGLVFVGGIFVRDPDLYGPATVDLPAMASPDLATSIGASIRFVAAQFERDPGGEADRELLATMMMTPPHVRRALLARSAAGADAWSGVRVPMLIIHGRRDRVIRPAMAEEGRRLVPHATIAMQEGIGHAPFLEDPATFNRQLAEFVRDATA
ncbi:MAG: putative hydrolases or acyltransferases (alpha/beta hydrolase superfamily) [Rhodobacteraceae bacterium HLUCCA12]|nr:MAG: putative hydrolases or acyltransferases (alpha/beta hydrolase superfamily) [Rhodobacteraceae bacterium HLUCCA12]